MAERARLSAPQPLERNEWPHHEVTWAALPARLLSQEDRRMEAENYLSSGYGVRLAIEAQPKEWMKVGDIANVWQPLRLKGIQVSPTFGTPFLAATQVFDLRPTPRKWLALDRTQGATERFVERGQILVTCSGAVGQATLAFESHLKTLITHDLLRVESKHEQYYGWLYAFLRSPQAYAMMTGAKYGHVIKHLECAHLNSLPIPVLQADALLEHFNSTTKDIVQKRDAAYALVKEGEELFSISIGKPKHPNSDTFEVSSSSFFHNRRRLDGAHYSPQVKAILAQFKKRHLTTEPLAEVTEKVWLMPRIKRVFGDSGVPYFSAEQLFSVNPKISKRVLIEQTDNADSFYVKKDWLVMARSGQAYGMLGSVAYVTETHARAFLSDDLIRIIPRKERIHPGYLLTALTHPTFGRPLVIRNAYGTSIPHLEPADISTFPIVRLGDSTEKAIGERMETAAILRVEADELENKIAADAEKIVSDFIGGVRPR